MDCSAWLHGSTVAPEPALGLDGLAGKCARTAGDTVIGARRSKASVLTVCCQPAKRTVPTVRDGKRLEYPRVRRLTPARSLGPESRTVAWRARVPALRLGAGWNDKPFSDGFGSIRRDRKPAVVQIWGRTTCRNGSHQHPQPDPFFRFPPSYRPAAQRARGSPVGQIRSVRRDGRPAAIHNRERTACGNGSHQCPQSAPCRSAPIFVTGRSKPTR
jgi:hypothetical protein